MNWKFWKEKEEVLDADDKIIRANYKAKEEIDHLVELHKSLRANEALSDAVKEKIKSIRNNQANIWLTLVHISDMDKIDNSE